MFVLFHTASKPFFWNEDCRFSAVKNRQKNVRDNHNYLFSLNSFLNVYKTTTPVLYILLSCVFYQGNVYILSPVNNSHDPLLLTSYVLFWLRDSSQQKLQTACCVSRVSLGSEEMSDKTVFLRRRADESIWNWCCRLNSCGNSEILLQTELWLLSNKENTQKSNYSSLWFGFQ